MAVAVGAARRRLLHHASPLAWVLAAGALGALAMVLSYIGNPIAGPAVCAGALLVAATIARPEIGIAAWFPMVPMGLLGAQVGPQWLLSSIWALFLFSLTIVRRPVGERIVGDLSSAASDEQRLRHSLPALAPVLLIFVAITLVEALLDVHFSAALKPIRTIVTGTLMFFVITAFVRERAHFVWVLAGIALAAGLVGAVAINDYRTGNTTFGFYGSSGELVERVTAGFGQPNQLGGFLAILVPLTIAGALVVRAGKLLFVLAGGLALAGVYLSFSRGALLALLAIPLVFLGVRRSLLFFPVALAILLTVIPGVLKERFATLTAGGGETATRLNIWNAAEKIWSAHPVLGVGPGGFPQAYTEANIPGKAFLPSTIFQPPPHAHDLFLNLLAEQGLIGLTAFLLLLGLALAGLARARHSTERWIRLTAVALMAMIAVFLVHNLFDVTLIEGTGQYVWALLGVCSALIAIEARRRSLLGASPHEPSRAASPPVAACVGGPKAP